MGETPWKFESSRPHHIPRPAAKVTGLVSFCAYNCDAAQQSTRRGVSEPTVDPKVEAAEDDRIEDAGYGIAPDIEEAVVDALEAEDTDRVRELLEPLHHADVADLLEHLSGDQREDLVEVIKDDFDPDVLSEVDDGVRDDIIEYLGWDEAASVIAEMEIDDAVLVIEELDEDEQQRVLRAIPAEERTFIEEALGYPADSAGRMMQREIVTVPSFWTVGETIDFMRSSADMDEDALPEVFYDIFVVDPRHRPIGALSLEQTPAVKRRAMKVGDIMETEMHVISVTTDQEEVAFVFRQRDLVSAPVVNEDGRLVGAITIDDVVDVIHEEHEEDFMALGGVSEDDLYSAAVDTTRSRFTWLLVNLGTAVLASLVIGLFEATLEQMVALAVLMPIVASMGGNAGTQTLTVAVRALATRELTETNALRVIGKEVLVGSFNGVLFAVITGGVAWVWFGNPAIGGVIAMAMVVNLIVAGLAGTAIPIVLERFGADPAIGSSVVLTTITDVAGFFVFLGSGRFVAVLI